MKLKKSSPLKLLSQSQPNFAEMIPGWSPFKTVRQRRPVSKMAAMTKNRNVFKWPKLLYFKPESAQNLSCISIMMSFLTFIMGFFMNFELLPILNDYAN